MEKYIFGYEMRYDETGAARGESREFCCLKARDAAAVLFPSSAAMRSCYRMCVSTRRDGEKLCSVNLWYNLMP